MVSLRRGVVVVSRRRSWRRRRLVRRLVVQSSSVKRSSWTSRVSVAGRVSHGLVALVVVSVVASRRGVASRGGSTWRRVGGGGVSRWR
ncbi:hypothetical protein ACXZ9C_11005 [Streptococcus agalactiae]